MLPAQSRPGQQNHGVEWQQRQQKIDADEQTFRQRKNVLRHIDLADQGKVCHHAAHGKIRRLGKIVEQRQPCHEIGEIAHAACRKAKDVLKHQRQHAHHQHGIEQTPQHTEHGALVFDLEIPRDQLLQQKAVFPCAERDMGDHPAASPAPSCAMRISAIFSLA